MLTQRFTDALVYAADLHKAQPRKGTRIPYVSHLLQVAGIALERGADEDVAIAALLHDAVEDQGGPPRLEEIRGKFGDRVAGIVDACTDAAPLPGQKKPDWRPRKQAYLDRLKHHGPDALLVTAADKLHNARSILLDLREDGVAAFDKFTGGVDGTLWYYRELAGILTDRLPGPLTRELVRTVGEIERLVEEAG